MIISRITAAAGKSSNAIDDKRDIDIIRQHHQFLWEDSDKTDEWGSRLAKKYWDKLFKEYCIVDLTLYKQNKIGMRWRLEKEVASGKGQFICGNKVCHVGNNLRSWEVHFGYVEQEQKKNALVKVRLCPTCSDKLNFHHKRREVVPAEKLSSVPPEEGEPQKKQRKVAELMVSTSSTAAVVGENVWSKSAVAVVDKSQEEEFDEYISDLFL